MCMYTNVYTYTIYTHVSNGQLDCQNIQPLVGHTQVSENSGSTSHYVSILVVMILPLDWMIWGLSESFTGRGQPWG